VRPELLLTLSGRQTRRNGPRAAIALAPVVIGHRRPVFCCVAGHTTRCPQVDLEPAKSARLIARLRIDYTHVSRATGDELCAFGSRSVSPARSRLRTIDRIEACAKPENLRALSTVWKTLP